MINQNSWLLDSLSNRSNQKVSNHINKKKFWKLYFAFEPFSGTDKQGIYPELPENTQITESGITELVWNTLKQ